MEARIKEHLAQESGPDGSTANEEVTSYLQGLISEYTPHPSGSSDIKSEDSKPALNLIKGGQDAPPTDDPAALEDQAPPEGAAPVEVVPTEAGAEAAMAEPTTPQPDPDAPIVIRQKTPAIEAAKLCHGRTMLGEIYMDKMSFFAGKRFSEGQAIVIEFLIPKRFIVNADVVYCRHYSMKSRIISGQKLPYRISVKFTFLKPGERTLLREFLESIEPDLTTVKKEVKPKKPASEGDGLDDLANLDV